MHVLACDVIVYCALLLVLKCKYVFSLYSALYSSTCNYISLSDSSYSSSSAHTTADNLISPHLPSVTVTRSTSRGSQSE